MTLLFKYNMRNFYAHAKNIYTSVLMRFHTQQRRSLLHILQLLLLTTEPAYDRRWPHHCQSAVHGCRLSTTELFLSPLSAPGTTCRATSRPHHLCLFSEAVWRRTSPGVLLRNFCSVPAKWLLSLLTL